MASYILVLVFIQNKAKSFTNSLTIYITTILFLSEKVKLLLWGIRILLGSTKTNIEKRVHVQGEG